MQELLMKLLIAKSVVAERKHHSQDITEKQPSGKHYVFGKRGSDISKKPDEGKGANYKDFTQKKDSTLKPTVL